MALKLSLTSRDNKYVSTLTFGERPELWDISHDVPDNTVRRGTITPDSRIDAVTAHDHDYTRSS
jgi:hypothetical protein